MYTDKEREMVNEWLNRNAPDYVMKVLVDLGEYSVFISDLYKRIRPYVRHDDHCGWGGDEYTPDCTCGLDEILYGKR
jgi:hypothetical protein